MTYFPMMKMTKVKEVSAFQITMSMYLFMPKLKMLIRKTNPCIGAFGIEWSVECPARVRKQESQKASCDDQYV